MTAATALFTEGRTHDVWQDKDVPDSLLRELYDLMKWGPTSANGNPMRVYFVKSKEAKERLKPHLDKGNVDKSMTAPVTAIIGMDLEFFEKLPKLYPHTDAKSWFVGRDAAISETAFRNSSMQGGYFIIAARMLGLDTGAMSGFNKEGVDKEFFAGTKIKSNFLCNIGYGDNTKLHPRYPRLSFDEACKIL